MTPTTATTTTTDTHDIPSYTIEELPTVFADVTPIPETETATVAKIDAPTGFVVSHNYWRAVVQEVSFRAYALTATCLRYNPANYSVWQHRRRCLFHLVNNSSSNNSENHPHSYNYTAPVAHALERAFMNETGGDNPKNYQIWFHRKRLVQEWGDYEYELSDTARIIATRDAKNYHAWCFRLWLVQQLQNWKEETLFCHEQIVADVRNNSAWNQRWFVRQQQQQEAKTNNDDDDDSVLQTELEYAMEQASIDTYNECPWRYLVAWIQQQEEPSVWATHYHDRIQQLAAPDSAHALAARVDLLQLLDDNDQQQQQSVADELMERLETEVDVIRQKYWKFRRRANNNKN